MIHNFKSSLKKFDHILLIGSLFFLVESPIWETLVYESGIWVDISTLLIIISGISIIFSQEKKRTNFMLYFGLITAGVTTLNLFIDSSFFFSRVVQNSQVGFFLMLTVILFGLIIRAKKVDAEVLINAVSGYLLLGISWAIIVAQWSNSFPGSFSFSEEFDFFNEIYFSFVTLTTLGYGDVLPNTTAAKSISILISITGAFYTTIVLGMIVGKYISNESLKSLNKDK